jgi:NADPH:quinone reductase-like Zn-dependent oxidoreductase
MAVRMEVQEFQSPAVLVPVEFDVVMPGDGEVLIRVQAAGVNPFDWKYVEGLSGRGAPTEFPIVPGNEVAGYVDAVGAGVTTVGMGDEVIWHGFLGGYASHLIVKATAVRPKPESIGFAEAASIPVAGGTAWAAINQAGVGKGDRVLIHGAAGGLGGFGIQIARNLNAHVIGTASAANHDYVRQLGAEPVEYGDGLEDRARAIGPVTAVVDFVGSAETIAATVALLPDLSRAITTAASPASTAAGITPVARDPKSVPSAIDLVGRGYVTVDVSRTMSIRNAERAFAESRTGHTRGKIVLIA